MRIQKTALISQHRQLPYLQPELLTQTLAQMSHLTESTNGDVNTASKRSRRNTGTQPHTSVSLTCPSWRRGVLTLNVMCTCTCTGRAILDITFSSHVPHLQITPDLMHMTKPTVSSRVYIDSPKTHGKTASSHHSCTVNRSFLCTCSGPVTVSNTEHSVSSLQSMLVATFCRHETKKQKAEPVVPQRRKTNQEKVSLSGSVLNTWLFSLPATCSKACLSPLTACLSACLSACPTPSLHLMWCLSRPS